MSVGIGLGWWLMGSITFLDFGRGRDGAVRAAAGRAVVGDDDLHAARRRRLLLLRAAAGLAASLSRPQRTLQAHRE